MDAARIAPTVLSRSALRNAAKLIALAKAGGAKSIVLHGATINFPRPQPAAADSRAQRAEHHDSWVRSQGAATPRRCEVAAASAIDGAPPVAESARRRRSARRLLEYQAKFVRLQRLCKLRGYFAWAIAIF